MASKPIKPTGHHKELCDFSLKTHGGATIFNSELGYKTHNCAFGFLERKTAETQGGKYVGTTNKDGKTLHWFIFPETKK